MSEFNVFSFNCTLEEIEKVRGVLGRVDEYSTDTITGLTLCTPNDLRGKGYLAIVIDEKDPGARKASAWIEEISRMLKAEENPEELLESVCERAVKERAYSLFASFADILLGGLKLMEDNIRANKSKEN